LLELPASATRSRLRCPPWFDDILIENLIFVEDCLENLIVVEDCLEN
jgi:hypothetical protein